MAEFDSTTRTKIDALRAIRAAQDGTEVYELVEIQWPSPTGSIFYACLQTDEVASVAPSVSPIETRLIPGSSPDWFCPVSQDASIGDEEVDITFWDADGVISDLLVLHGEGIKCILYFWFPQVDLLLPQWHGHLRNEEEAEVDVLPVKIAQGFRSGESDVPGRAHYQPCQAVFGGLLTTQAEIDEHDCPYNFHIGGGIGNDDPATSNPWTFCNRVDQQSCIDRAVPPEYHLSHRTITAVTANFQSSGPNLFSTSHGNETNLKESVRVVMGERRIYDCKVMAYRKDLNNNNPDHGWFAALYELCEGPIAAILYPQIEVDGKFQDAIAMHYAARYGLKGQVPLITSISLHAYAGTAHIYYNFGWVDPRTVEANEATANAVIHGLNNIRAYTDDTAYTEGVSTNRAWHIMRILADKRWGFGYDYARFNKTSWIAAASWCAEQVRFIDFNGEVFDHVRSRSDVDLNAKKVQEQIDDMCMAGRLSRPFLFDGELHIEPLRALTTAELDACPVFTDEGVDRNIVWEGDEGEEKSTLKISRKSDLDLPNRVECVFDDNEEGSLEMPVRPVEDVDAQLRAGIVVGDHSRKVNTKKYPLLGVSLKPQSVKMAWSLLDLGPFDEGGLQNNLSLKFKIWYLDAIDLHPFKVIKVVSSRLTRYGFTYFRVMKMNREENLIVSLELQAYNETYMASFETNFADIVVNPPSEPIGPWFPPGIDPPVGDINYGNIKFYDGILTVPVELAY